MGFFTEQEVSRFIEENDVKFIRLAFCDILGNQKNISILADEISRAFEMGISFDASAITGFTDISHSDMLLFPDPSTLTILPWRPVEGRVARVFCNIKYPDGRIYEGDSRNVLRETVLKAVNEGYDIKIGAESEFYLFKLDENGDQTDTPMDNGGYFDVAPLDKGENIRREICLALAEMGIKPVSSHHERGPGQNEIVFRFSDALKAADNFTSFKNVVKTIASREGLWASFMPRPIDDNIGSGLHVNISVYKDDCNIFSDENSDVPSKETEYFIAGIMEHIREITAFLNPTPNSYKRLGGLEAPKYISWSHQNRSQLIRIPAASGEYKRLELRSPDGSVNPYLAFSLIILAGLDGIKKELPLPPAVNEDLSVDSAARSSLKSLPGTLLEALDLARNSEFVKSVIPGDTLEKFFGVLESEA